MLKTKVDVTVEFDHHRPITEIDPEDAYDELRRVQPVAWSNQHGGFWVITRHADVQHVLRDFRNFSSRSGMAIPPHPSVDIAIPVHLDPPVHSGYRRAMNPHMSRESVEHLRERIGYWTSHYIDQVIESGKCDLAYDLSVPVPCGVTLEWVGWDARDEWDRIAVAWHDLLSRPLDHPRTQQSHKDLAWFSQRVHEELDKRRREPRDDVLSYVAHLEINGTPITREEAASMVTVWIAGGVDTATTSIVAILIHLARHPEDRRRLSEEPELWATATEELLRRYPPTRMTGRDVVQDTELGGCLLEAGDRVLVALGAANLDPEVFPNPREVILDRTPNNHMTFGTGAHRCVGMYLARAEIREVVSQVLERMPDYRLVEDAIEPYLRQSEMQGWISAPSVFTPGARLTAREPVAAGA